jgi:hypothetical protein
MTLTRRVAARGMCTLVATLGLGLLPRLAHAQERTQTTSVAVCVDGESQAAAGMLERLQKRGARQGVAVTGADAGCQLRILVLTRGPQWHHVFGVSASGATAVLDAQGELLWMHLRQKEATTGGAMDAMAEEIVERLPALLRGEKLLTR